MEKGIREYVQQDRRDFKNQDISKETMADDPLVQFEQWFGEALQAKIQEPYAFTLATASTKGVPNARVVYMRDLSKEGFAFFTNYHSDKGADLAENPHCTANFFWMELDRQVKFSGTAEKLSPEASDAYFNSRPRGSRIGAWTSDQSSVLKDREELLRKLEKWTQEFEGKDVPRPPHWGGYLIKPSKVEFWQGRESRLHDRILYTLTANGKWLKDRLSP